MMIRIRLFEECVSKLKSEKHISGPVHTCIGQEAVCAGVCMALSKDDFIIGNHRSHGHLIAKGVDLKSLMAQVFKGDGSSMHVSDPSVGALCSTAIVGSGLALACGVAFATKYKEEKNIACVFIGDGAVNEGSFYESVNLASLWRLPVLFVIENNGVAVTTLSENEELIYRAYPFNIYRQKIYGQDVEEVYTATQRAIEHINTTGRSAMIEAITYRFKEHQEGPAYDRMKEMGYRDNEETEYWIENRDPIELYWDKLIREKVLTRYDTIDIVGQEEILVAESVECAKNSTNELR